MTEKIKKQRVKLLLTLLLIAGFFTLSAPAAQASGGKDCAVNGSVPATASASSDDTDCKDESAGRKDANVAYKLYSDLRTAPEPEKAFSANVTASVREPRTIPAASLKPRASTAPMTPGEKFGLFLNKSFRPPGPYIQSIASGLFNEALDNNVGKEDTAGDFFADSMTRAARSFGNRIANNFFEKFVYASILRQDPRYHRSNKKGAGAKIGYAISRVFITQGDRSGDQPNISYLAGGLTGAAISNYWQREENRTVSKTFSRWATHIAIGMASNILREFLGGQ